MPSPRYPLACMALGLLLACPVEHAPPGGDDVVCGAQTPCPTGLRCVAGACVQASVDAAAADGQLVDAQGRDTLAPDGAPGADARPPDGAAGDALADASPAVDSAAPADATGPQDGAAGQDGSSAPDGAAAQDGAAPGDAASAADHAVLTDAQAGSDTARPDSGGLDLATLPDVAGWLEGGLGFDAGLVAYSGTAENGVVCGSATCNPSDLCCVGFSTSCVAPNSACPAFSVPVPCDGDEDCPGTQECCVRGSGVTDFQVLCVDPGACAGTGAPVCITSGDCGAGGSCCASSLLQGMGLDIGICGASCQ